MQNKNRNQENEEIIREVRVMNPAGFIVNDKCIGCGKCIKVCPGGVLYMGEDRKPHIQEFEEFGWNGCWRCEHCLAVCPEGAVSILNHRPEESIQAPGPDTAAPVMDALVASRRACRRYKRRNVPGEVIADMISKLANAPNGGNKQLVEYTLIDDIDQMDHFRDLVREEMERLAGQGVYPEGFGKDAYEDMKRWEKTVRPDMFFCGAPHILIPHAPLGSGEPVLDVIIAGTYFELLCASRGLGSVMMTFPLSVLELMPQIRAMLEIPEDHYVGMLIGFGYPQIPYVRGTQRTVEQEKVHRLSFTGEKDRVL